MSNAITPVSLAMTKVAVGFAEMPLFESFVSPIHGVLNFTAYTSNSGHSAYFRNLNVGQVKDQTPMSGSLLCAIASDWLEDMGCIYAPKMSTLWQTTRIAPPACLSAHDRLAAVAGARDFLIGLGFDPDQPDLISPLVLNNFLETRRDRLAH